MTPLFLHTLNSKNGQGVEILSKTSFYHSIHKNFLIQLKEIFPRKSKTNDTRHTTRETSSDWYVKGLEHLRFMSN